MAEQREWKWMVGILHGIGECFWEESGGKIRIRTAKPSDGTAPLVLAASSVRQVWPATLPVVAL